MKKLALLMPLIGALSLGLLAPAVANHKPGSQVRGVTPTANLQANDRIVFAGDSITYLGQTTTPQSGYGWLEQFEQVATSSKPNMTVFDSGVPGDTSINLAQRFNQTVLAFNPTVLVIWIGINDIGHRVPTKTTQNMIFAMVNAALTNPNIREIILVTPECFGERPDGRNAYDKEIDAYSYFLYQVVVNSHNPRLFYMPMRDLWGYEESRVNPSRKVIEGALTYDGLHPSPAGSNFLANAFAFMFELPYSL